MSVDDLQGHRDKESEQDKRLDARFPGLCNYEGAEFRVNESLIVSTPTGVHCIAVLLCGETKVLLGYNPSTKQFCPFPHAAISELISALSVLIPSTSALPLLKEVEEKYGDLSVAQNKAMRLNVSPTLSADVSGSNNALEGQMRLLLPDGSAARFELAAIAHLQNMSIGVAAIAQSELKAFNGFSSQEFYRLEWTNKSTMFSARGCLARGCAKENHLIVSISPMQFELMQTRKPGDLRARGVHPLEMAKYMALVEDFGIAGFKGPEGFESTDSMFLVVAKLDGFVLGDSQFHFGDVRFGSSIDIADEFKSVLGDYSESSCLVWTLQNGTGFAEAQRAALSRMEAAVAVVELLAIRDRLTEPDFPEGEIEAWDYSKRRKRLCVTKPFYIENCDDGAYIIDGGGASDILAVTSANDHFAAVFEQDWIIDLASTRLTTSNHYLIDAARWLIKARHEEVREDQIVCLNTALEYCVTGEQGETVMASIMREIGLDSDYSVEFEKDYWDSIAKTMDTAFLGDPEDSQARNARKRLAGLITASANRHSFASRFICMVKRLGNPINSSDSELLVKVNKIRNRLLHGKPPQLLDSVEMVRALNAAGIVIVSKMRLQGGCKEQ